MGEASLKPYFTWSHMFHIAEHVADPRRTTIGRYFIRAFDFHGDRRIISFRIYAFCAGYREDLGFDVTLSRWEYEQGDHPYQGVLRDLWSLPETPIERPYDKLTAGRFLWFLHCFELILPTLFDGPFAYDRSDDHHNSLPIPTCVR